MPGARSSLPNVARPGILPLGGPPTGTAKLAVDHGVVATVSDCIFSVNACRDALVSNYRGIVAPA
jgi:hypothetical protein